VSAVECRLCGSASTAYAGSATGRKSGRRFELRRCSSCSFAFVAEPWLDYAEIYDEGYYRGQGADPSVDYAGEAEDPERTVRRHEWRGVLARVRSLADAGPATEWLDYGCGMGGLVSHLRREGLDGAVGFEQGWCAAQLAARGVPHITEDELPAHAGTFDVVTAIEVIEHVVDPVAELRKVRALMRPGGLLFLTTGNPAPFRDRLASWRYVVPEVHISFFEPQTLAMALDRAGFEPAFPGLGPGWDDIMRFKLLKAFRRRRISPLERLVPWSLAAKAVDRRLQLSAQPVGWARA
jgi:SAM-dependent methyltransferase